DGVGLDFLGVLSVCSGAVHHFEINGALGNASQRNPVIEKLLPVIRNWTKVDDGGLIAGVGADDRLLSAVQNLAGVAAGGVDRDVAVEHGNARFVRADLDHQFVAANIKERL